MKNFLAFVGKTLHHGLFELSANIKPRRLIFEAAGGMKHNQPFYAVETGGSSGDYPAITRFEVDTPMCVGCGACRLVCPNQAIAGEINAPYFIIKEVCLGCGNCSAACNFNAIIIRKE